MENLKNLDFRENLENLENLDFRENLENLDFTKKNKNLENLDFEKIENLAKLGTCSMKIHMEFWAQAPNSI